MDVWYLTLRPGGAPHRARDSSRRIDAERGSSGNDDTEAPAPAPAAPAPAPAAPTIDMPPIVPPITSPATPSVSATPTSASRKFSRRLSAGISSAASLLSPREKQVEAKTLEIGVPTMVQHVTHVGWSVDKGFDVSGLPTEWKELFKQAGVRRSDLTDPETSRVILGVLVESMRAGETSGIEGLALPSLPGLCAPVPEYAPVLLENSPGDLDQELEELERSIREEAAINTPTVDIDSVDVVGGGSFTADTTAAGANGDSARSGRTEDAVTAADLEMMGFDKERVANMLKATNGDTAAALERLLAGADPSPQASSRERENSDWPRRRSHQSRRQSRRNR